MSLHVLCSCPQLYSGELSPSPYLSGPKINLGEEKARTVSSHRTAQSILLKVKHVEHLSCTCHLMPWLREQVSDTRSSALFLLLPWCVFIEMGETKSEGIYKTHIIRSVERSST